MVKNMLPVILLLGVYIASAQQQPGHTSSPTIRTALQKIYLTTDKVIYTPNEQLWFAAYLFENQSLVRDTADVLTLGLYDCVSGQMLALKKFPLHNRVATGNILLPDSLIAGNYNLVAYTNIVDTQHVPIGTGFKPLRIYAKTGEKAFTTLLKILDSLSTSDKIVVQHQIIPESYQVTFKNARARYQLAGERSKNLELDKYGNGMVYINPKDIKTANRSFSVTTIYNGDTVKNRIRIPGNIGVQANVSASFYPEGGFLAPGYPNRVFWEVTDKHTATSMRALLLEDNQVIDTIETSANGMSFFYVNAKPGRQYAVSLGLKTNSPKFLLPPVASHGIRFEIPDVVVNDSLTIELWSTEKRSLKLMVIDITGLPSVHSFDISSYKKLTVLLNDFARGLCKIFIADEQNNVVAGSYFFSHYNNRNQLHLETDKAAYKTRDSVALKVTIVDKDGNPINSVATISCALLSRIDFGMIKNIESDHDLGVVAHQERSFLKRRNILDSAMLLRHIIRMKNMEETDTLLIYGRHTGSFLKPVVQLQLARFGKREKKPMELVLFKESNFSILKTNEEGILTLSNDELLVKDGRKLFVKGMGKKNGDFYVQTEDSLLTAHSNIEVPVYNPVYREQAPDLQALLKTDREEKFSSTMETVIVRSKRDYGATTGIANPCGDYVCQYNILNCPNHTIPYKWPVIGQKYRSVSGEIIYQGCDYQNNMYLPPASLVYLPRNFLGMDSTLLKQEFPEYLSTLSWHPFKKLKKETENQLVFHTSDQKGVYLITVQGFAENGQPFYGEKTIRVED